MPYLYYPVLPQKDYIIHFLETLKTEAQQVTHQYAFNFFQSC